MTRRKQFSGAVITLLALAALTYFLFQQDQDEVVADSAVPDEPAIRVEVISAGGVALPELDQRYRGTVRARRDSMLAFRRSGRIQSVSVREGDAVSAGDVIAQLDVSDLNSRLQQALAARDSAQANLDEAMAGPRKQTIAAAVTEVNRFSALLGAAKNQRSRQTSLLKRGAGSQQAVDDLGFEVQRLEAEVAAARLRLDELNEGTRVEQIAAAKAALAVAEAAVGQVKVDLADSRIVAPFDGWVAGRMVDEGTLATQLQMALRLVETPPYEARFGLPADLVGELTLGQSLQVDLDHSHGQTDQETVSAEVVRVHPTIDLATRTRAVDVRFTVQAPVVVGQSVTVLVSPRTPERVSNSFWIPTEALVRGSRGLWSVLAVVDSNPSEPNLGFIERRNVRVLRTNGSLSEVIGMIQPGDRIVASGTHRVAPGSTVEPIDWDIADADSTESVR